VLVVLPFYFQVYFWIRFLQWTLVRLSIIRLISIITRGFYHYAQTNVTSEN